ncbi:MAG: response regulator [Schwartzia sp.]|nr:response regulator [Schwartzia sp. (in: firmicutes)]MBR1761098.1 response regulator [Schwartzia sp. (in: firmicutes)]MBR1886732.1 response regulator [Schwartzia sp. (in: firmicutes)]
MRKFAQETEEGEMQRILVVDDDDMNLKMAEFILKKDMKEIEVLLADTGMKAIDILQREKVDLVLLDFQMPVMNGLKTLELIRKREDLKDIPVIFLTASSDRDTVVKAGLMGVADYIKKPFMPKDLVERVNKALLYKALDNPLLADLLGKKA